MKNIKKSNNNVNSEKIKSNTFLKSILNLQP